MTRRKTSARALVQEAFAQETPGQGVAPEAQLLDALAMSAALAPLTAPPAAPEAPAHGGDPPAPARVL